MIGSVEVIGVVQACPFSSIGLPEAPSARSGPAPTFKAPAVVRMPQCFVDGWAKFAHERPGNLPGLNPTSVMQQLPDSREGGLKHSVATVSGAGPKCLAGPPQIGSSWVRNVGSRRALPEPGQHGSCLHQHLRVSGSATYPEHGPEAEEMLMWGPSACWEELLDTAFDGC